MKNSAAIRSAFLNYFRHQGHTILPSSSLIPHNDPTLLFTNSGMVQFKDILLGTEDTPHDKVATVQRCVRAGGKHNDLENIGYTTRHHTFFEMLGNFSFGAYFKREAIAYAWHFLTKELDIPKSHLRITVFTEDDETANIWLHDIGIKPEQLSRLGKQDNFWQMGDTGPCGPCTEIFYDHGEQKEKNGIAQDRYVEIWNLVFTQYNLHANGDISPLPKPAVDTGMGLERIAAVMQNVQDNYDIDSFKRILSSIKQPANITTSTTISTRVIADHIRSCSFLIADGVLPDNDGRGYVLRRIIRRAIRHGNKIGLNKPFFHKLVTPLQQSMDEAYPELKQHKKQITNTLLKEEERFAQTLQQGLKHLKTTIDTMQGTTIPGQDIFKLYDTYGFPADLTADIAREQDLQLDYPGFEKAMSEQRARARSASKFDIDLSVLPSTDLKTEFIGYQLDNETTSATVIGIHQLGGEKAERLQMGESGQIILDSTTFYAESGGQIGDTGKLLGENICFQVEDTQKTANTHVHIGTLLKGEIHIGQTLSCKIDKERRLHIMRHHSATHLLHAALKQILGAQVAQKGSLVSAENLRFDFSYNQPISSEQIHQIEYLVNEKILQNKQTTVQTMALEEAKQSGAISLFNEKYAQTVRVLNIGGSFSKELCGGTHVNRTGDIGLIKIISQASVAAGVRRIEAITGEKSLHWIHKNEKKLDELSKLLKTDRDSIVPHFKKNLEITYNMEKTLSKLQKKQAENASHQIITQAEKINGIHVSAQILEGVNIQTLKETADRIQQQLGQAILVLATIENNKVTLISSVTKNISGTINAVELINFVAHQIDGKGGGRPDMAQGGGSNPAALNTALASMPDWVRNKLQNTTA